MQVIIEYIIKILLSEENENLVQLVSYGENRPQAPIQIKPSGFFGSDLYLKKESMPILPLKEIDGIPILYGEPRIEKRPDKILIYADIVASTFFMISRYEECINCSDRDKHGRFLGRYSILYKAGYSMRPLVDEYRELLLNCLQEMGISVYIRRNCVKKIFLTHDVDQIWNWRNLYSASKTCIKRILKHEDNKMESILSWLNYKKYDKIYTFPWLTQKDNDLKFSVGKDIVESIYFFMGSTKSEYDSGYINRRRRVKELSEFLKEQGAVLGIHVSYVSGKHPQGIWKEKKRLENVLEGDIKCNRNHYLTSREPSDMRYLLKNNIESDFTMGYADTIGFRLGTCYPVHWIDPVNLEITDLILHPMSVMECTLDGEDYMALDEQTAYNVVCQTVDTIYNYGGEIVLLWHNSSVAENAEGYQRRLYEKVLQYMERKMKNEV